MGLLEQYWKENTAPPNTDLGPWDPYPCGVVDSLSWIVGKVRALIAEEEATLQQLAAEQPDATGTGAEDWWHCSWACHLYARRRFYELLEETPKWEEEGKRCN